MTRTKHGRTYETVTMKDSKGEEYLHEQKRAERLPAKPRQSKACGVCGGPMMVSIGQIARFHRECREQGRRSKGSRYRS